MAFEVVLDGKVVARFPEATAFRINIPDIVEFYSHGQHQVGAMRLGYQNVIRVYEPKATRPTRRK